MSNNAEVLESPSDQYRDPELLAWLRRIAAEIFGRHGMDFATARRAGGWTNATWLAGGLVLRLAVRKENDSIIQEAQLAALFPPEVGFPAIIQTGITEGHAWSMAKAVPGQNLGEVWPSLDWDSRISALRQLWAKILAVHTTDVTLAGQFARKQAWFNAADANEAQSALYRLASQAILTTHQVRILSKALDNFWQVLPDATPVLNHGDLTIENALWHAGRVVALLDFEYAVIAPAELDLNELVKMAFAPPEKADPLPDPNQVGLRRMRRAVLEMARPVISHSGGIELLTGYAILLELWMLEDWLKHPEGEGPLEGWQPYRMLVSLAGGNYGYLSSLLGVK